jgi:uncharacterized protein YkwD
MRLWLAATGSCILALAAPRIALALAIDAQNRTDVVASYNSAYVGSEGVAAGWNGDYSTCNSGAVSAAYLDAGLLRINWVRAMAGLPSIAALDAAKNAKCQSGSLLMTANRALSHSPPTSWACYTTDGAEAASKSNLAGGYPTLAAAITGWVKDDNIVSAGHRRWILYPPLVSTALGATFGNSYPAYAMWVIGMSGARPSAPEWVAWPPPGYVPYTVVNGLWSFAYSGAGFAGATVTMTRNGSPASVTLHPVQNGYGDNTLVWTVQSYSSSKPASDVVYSVTVSNVVVAGSPRSFQYSVTVIDPAATTSVDPGVAGRSLQLSGGRPNPFDDATRVTFVLTEPSVVNAGVYDVHGRRIATLARGVHAAGIHVLIWNGTDAGGRTVPVGRYFVRVRAGNREAAKAVVRAR